MGQTVSPGDMHWQAWPASAATGNFIRKNDRPDAIEELAGSIARAPFVAGEPIREAKLIKAKGSGYMAAILPSGMRAVSTEISPETGAGGFILPNDRVDVILSRRDRDAEKAAGVEVAYQRNHPHQRPRAGDRPDRRGEERPAVVVGKTATLELTPRQAETLALSQQLGTLSLALRSIADASRDDTERPTTTRAAPQRRQHRPLRRQHDDDTEMIESRGHRGHGERTLIRTAALAALIVARGPGADRPRRTAADPRACR